MKFIYNCILLFLFVNGIQLNTHAQNLALNKPYSLSIPPNYPLSASLSDKKSLTDGKYSTGDFWKQETTIGWQGRGVQVLISIDLENILPVGAVTFNTFQRKGGDVYFPQHIFIFTSIDNKNFSYVGDAVGLISQTSNENNSKKFILDNIDVNARYIILNVIANGYYIFCDEVEVLKSKNKITKSNRNIKIVNLEYAIDSLKIIKNDQAYLIDAITNLEKYKISNEVNNKDLINIENEITTIKLQLITISPSNNDLFIIRKRIEHLYGLYMNDKFNLPYILGGYNPWNFLYEFYVPQINNTSLDYNFIIEKTNSQYGAFVLTNTNLFNEKFYFQILGNRELNNIELYKVPFIRSDFATMTPDPMILINDSVQISAGTSMLFIFKLNGLEVGELSNSIEISSSGKKSQIRISSRILSSPELNSNGYLNANVWAYPNSPILKSVTIKKVSDDLQQHHINSIVIPPNVLPEVGGYDFKNLIDYVNNFKNAKYIFLYANFTSDYRKIGISKNVFLSEGWKKVFKPWYIAILNAILNVNESSEVFFYPYDEVGGQNINDFRNLIIWSKKDFKDIKFYATINNKIALDSILPLIDIAQITSLKDYSFPENKTEIWSYKTEGKARSLSPYNYYRLMGWEAFVKNYKGIGFWNYCDEGNNYNTILITNNQVEFSTNYSVIYLSPDNEIITSRRWEAFRLGIEDYSILQVYAKKFGDDKAKELAKQVMINPDNLNLADSIRNNMLTELTQSNK